MACVRFLEKKHYGGVQCYYRYDYEVIWHPQILEKKCYGCLRFNVISFTREAGGVIFPGEKRYVTPEWPPHIHYRGELSRSLRPIVFVFVIWEKLTWTSITVSEELEKITSFKVKMHQAVR